MIPSINVGSSKAAVIARLAKFPKELNNASEKLRADVDVVRVAVEKDGLMIRHASRDLRNDIELVKIAVSNNGLALQHCLKIPRVDPEVINLAMTQNVKSIHYVGEMSRQILRIVLELDAEYVMQYYWHAHRMNRDYNNEINFDYNGVGRELQRQYARLFTKELCMIAVTQNGKCLSFVPKKLKDYEIVMQAVSQDGLALQHARSRFKRNREICQVAIQQNGQAYQHIADNLRADKELLMLAIPTYPYAYQFHRENSIFTNDIEVILEVLKMKPDLYKSPTFNIENNIKAANVRDKTLLQATVDNGNQYTIRNMTGDVVSAFEMNDQDKDYGKMKQIIAEHTGLVLGAIVLDIEPKIAIISKGRHKGRFGEIIKTTNQMYSIKLVGDGKEIKIYKDSVLEY